MKISDIVHAKRYLGTGAEHSISRAQGGTLCTHLLDAGERDKISSRPILVCPGTYDFVALYSKLVLGLRHPQNVRLQHFHLHVSGKTPLCCLS